MYIHFLHWEAADKNQTSDHCKRGPSFGSTSRSSPRTFVPWILLYLPSLMKLLLGRTNRSTGFGFHPWEWLKSASLGFWGSCKDPKCRVHIENHGVLSSLSVSLLSLSFSIRLFIAWNTFQASLNQKIASQMRNSMCGVASGRAESRSSTCGTGTQFLSVFIPPACFCLMSSSLFLDTWCEKIPYPNLPSMDRFYFVSSPTSPIPIFGFGGIMTSIKESSDDPPVVKGASLCSL